MKILRYHFIIPVLFFVVSCSEAQIILVDQKQSDYVIVIAANADPGEKKAAEEFRDYFEKISGVKLPMVDENQPSAAHEIIIGNGNRLQQNKIRPGFGKDNADAFLIRTKGEKLFIAGGSPSGTLNGVYSFLEKYLGCRYYTPSVIKIPRLARIELPELNDREFPVFSFRELYFPARYDTVYRAWHKLNSHQAGSWGMWVHTFDDLVPPESYFDDYPEYFSEINGARTSKGQLCLSNPEVLKVLTTNLKEKMSRNPGAKYWSVSQNDNYLACQCENCKRISEKYGGESGLMIWFVNQVAEHFPEKVISTLAYQYTRSAPKQISPLPNVNIMLCTIECNRSKPIKDDPSSASFVQDIKDWTKLTGNILIWDYVVQFRNYISPFPNLNVLQPNLEFFADYGCRLMFQQGSGSALSEFVDLRTYLIAKLLWDPEADATDIMDDFIYGYYGAAAPFIKDYITMLHEELGNSGGDLWIYGYPYSGISSFLRPVMIPAYTQLFDEAEKAVKNDAEILDRIWFAKLPLDYAVLDISLHQVDEDLSWFSVKKGKFEIKEDMVNLLDTFVNRCNRMNVKMLNEQGFTPDEYRLLVNQYLLKSADRHLAIDRPVELMTAFSPKYEAGGAAALTDGLRGINDYHFNWLGFEGEDLEAVIDLGEEKTISEIKADFLQEVQAWVFLPKSFTAYYSTDGEELIKIGTDINITPDNKTGSFIQTFSIPAGNIRARYIRVRAESMKTCPSWHIGSGSKSWIFTDEILIK
jgi:hypothetical protein